MRKKKALKVSLDEIKKYCPFVKNIKIFYENHEKKNNVVLSVMSNLCPIGKAINKKHLIVIDNKSKINIFKILRGYNLYSRQNVEECIKKNNVIIEGKCKHLETQNSDLYLYEHEIKKNNNSCNENTILEILKSPYNIFQNECNNDLKELINKLFIDKRYRIFTILNKLRKIYPNVYIENNKLLLSSFYEFYQKFGYKLCIGASPYNIKRVLDCSTIKLDYTIDKIKEINHENNIDKLIMTNNSMNKIKDIYNINLNDFRKRGITNDKTVIWCSNDYLSLSNNEQVIDVGIETLKRIGNSSGGTRNISGSLLNHTHLEYILARWFNKESALLFTSGYIANMGALGTLGKLLNLVFVSDQMNHASIINGIQESRCEKYIFKHNDMTDLENVLKSLRMKKEYKNRKIMIVFESIYSMSGNISDIKKIVQLAKKYNALTYIDEVHAVGLYGKTGSGYSEELNLCDEIDIINGTLSKAIGSLGGFICANKYYIDVIRSYSPHFIFTTSLTPVNITTSAEAIYIIQNDMELRNKFRNVVNKTKEKLKERGILIIDNDSHIVVTLINCPQKCKQICDDLLTMYNIYLQPINYPTVPKGSERIRITPSPYHTEEQISKLADSLYTLFKKYEVNMFNKKNKIEMKL
ncbi:delta-aminolevulinic acid synthetase, putative [Plasmodium vinckei brucechwatti]|uniref:5-aminolevulinate synthase n=1 Tax=Plasmodium vinckei brucechwatti TaxID=119398 RepID=A0A6V7T3I1_PLAVN|nr:delta-aminolevulinic acid synthetase, putative [Plasmodium vinckei brucechwatti]